MEISLTYPGKKSLEAIKGYKPEGRLIFDKNEPCHYENTVFAGDNYPILALLKKQLYQSIDLIYIDPPFGTGRAFTGQQEIPAYDDHLLDHHYLEFLRERLILMRELLSERGSIYVHIDKKTGHYVKIMMDEVFGRRNYLNDISRIKCNPKNFERKAYGNSTDMILFYAVNQGRHIWNEQREPLSKEEIRTLFPKKDPIHGPYTTHPLHAPGKTLNGKTGQEWKGLLPPHGRHWRYPPEVLDQLEQENLIEWSSTGNPRKKVFAKHHKGRKLQDFWTYKDKGKTYTQYPTEKNKELLQRIILQSSNPSSIVLDAFAGSGNTLLMAHQLGRKWLGIDQSRVALSVIEQNFSQHNIPFHLARYEAYGKKH